MKITKKVLTIIISLTLVVGGFYYVAPNATKADADFSITSPKDGSMKGAGYFDIKWEDASSIKPVNSYDVFIDGSLVKNTTETKYEFYTVKVYYHKAWIRANFKDGTSQYTRTVRFGVTKKGLAVSNNMAKNTDPNEMKIGWYYNWGRNPFSSSFAGGKYNSIDYVPMVWGDTEPDMIQFNLDSAIYSGYKYILGFNEPDIPMGSMGGSQMELSRVVELWPNFLGKNIKVGSPAYSLGGLDPNDPEKAAKMFPGFMAAVENKVDYVCIHAYPDNWNGGKDMADWLLDTVCKGAYEKYGKKVWVTEYSTSGNGITQNGTASFARYFNDGANSRDFIERHSFYSFNNEERPGLWDYSTGVLSKAGQAYRDYGNPETDYVTGDYVNPRDSEPTTETPTTTEEEGFVPNKDVPQDDWADFGIYGVYTGTWSGDNTAKAGVDPYDPTHIIVKKTDNNLSNAWLTQIRILLTDLDPNEEYTYEWPIKATNNKGSVKSSNGTEGDDNVAQLNGGAQTLTGKTELKDGVHTVVVGMGSVDPTNPIEFNYPTVKDKYGTVVYPKETPTTKAPTTKPTTTPAPTTTTTKAPETDPTSEPTVKPSVDPTVQPTAKPTAKPTKKVKKLAKVKIKKAKNKKKRKIKITLKKVAGAQGYHIKYSDSKKFDGYWEKYTKKVKITLKKLDKNTKYYIKARAYKKANGAIIYGKWSKKKKVKVKK